MLKLKSMKLIDCEPYNNVIIMNADSIEEVFTDTIYIECILDETKETHIVYTDSLVYLVPYSNKDEEDKANVCKIYQFPNYKKQIGEIPSEEEEDNFFNMLERDFGIKTTRKKEIIKETKEDNQDCLNDTLNCYVEYLSKILRNLQDNHLKKFQ